NRLEAAFRRAVQKAASIGFDHCHVGILRIVGRFPGTNQKSLGSYLDVRVDTGTLRPGTYHGTITVKAGSESVDIPVTLTLTSGAAVTPVVGAIVNGAST